MIGAVRHGGMIPWDDDIDVYMLRSDYNRFIALKQSLVNTEYEIVDPAETDNYCLMAKYQYRNSTLWEYENIPYLLGVYIDVFALDYEDGSYEEMVKKRMNFQRTSNLFCMSAIQRSWRKIFNLFACGHIKKGLGAIYQKCVIRPRRESFRREVLRQSSKTSGEWLVLYSGVYGKKDVFRSEWFERKILFPFEDTTIHVPSGYNDYLTKKYGDYMKFPPEDKRISRHPHFFVDLNRRISKDEMQVILDRSYS